MTAALSPILLANTGYHIGHQMSIRVAEEQGFFQQEGFSNYEYEWRGLVPGPFERDALDLVIREHGVDIATAVKVESLLHQRTQVFGAKRVRELGQLRGGRIVIREDRGAGPRLYHQRSANGGRGPCGRDRMGVRRGPRLWHQPGSGRDASTR